MTKDSGKTPQEARSRSWKTSGLALACLLIGGLQSVLAQPQHLDLGLDLVQQIQNQQMNGVFTDANGTDLNRRGGSWGSSSNPVYLQFEEASQGTLPSA